MNMRYVLTAVAVFGAAALTGRGADWPNFRGPNRDGISPETGINFDWAGKPPKILWTVPLSDDGYSGPSAANGTVYIVDHRKNSDVVLALDLKTGRERWQFPYSVRGREHYGFARSTPAVEDGRIYTISRDGVVHCLEAALGKKVWRCDALDEVKGKAPKWGVSHSPVIEGGMLIVPGGGKDAHVLGLNKETGKILWQGGGTARLGYATPVVAEIEQRKQYVVLHGKGLIGIDSKTGERIWSQKWKTNYDVNASTPLVLDNGSVFITSGYKTGCALVKVAGDQATIAWDSDKMNAQFSSPILVNGLIYGTSDPGYLICMEPSTGNVRWKHKDFQKGGLVGVDGHMIVLDGHDGDAALVEITPEQYREKGRIKPLGGQTWVAPIIADKKLIIRNRKQLAVVDLS